MRVLNMKKKQEEFQIKFLDDYSKRNLIDNYRKAQRRLLLLDYDGTLKPFTSTPSEAFPDKDLIALLQKLNVDRNTVCLISGRNSAWLEQWFGSTNIYLVAEHGARFRLPGENWTSKVSSSNNWKGPVKQIMQAYVSKCEHSFIEEKDFSMVWHYRKANPDQAKLYAAEMTIELNNFIQGHSLKVFSGKKIVEVKNSQIDKGSAIQHILRDGNYDFILAVGDDYTDEDMFKVLTGVRNSYTIKVGNEASYAAFNLYSPQMVISLLEIMSVIID